jgi:hypothetical protein
MSVEGMSRDDFPRFETSPPIPGRLAQGIGQSLCGLVGDGSHCGDTVGYIGAIFLPECSLGSEIERFSLI